MPILEIEELQTKAASDYYDGNYFNWQKDIGAFGGWANAHKFEGQISSSDVVVDFGCGGGFLLANLNCHRKIGIEPNIVAREYAATIGIECYESARELELHIGPESVDVVISNNVLEHTLNPLQELLNLYPLLKMGGRIHFFVPCDSIAYKYDADDRNYHLYSWSPQNLGNLFLEAGYAISYSRPFIHKWPPGYMKLAKLGWPIFNILCRIYGQIDRSWFQVEIVAIKNKK